LGKTVSQTLSVPKNYNPSVLQVISNNLFVATGNCLAVWNIDTGQFIKQLPDGHTKRVKTIAKVDDQVWSGAEDSAICIWSSTVRQFILFVTHSLVVPIAKENRGTQWQD
jgi:hypothetical protein